MAIGKAWVIVEECHHSGLSKVISILNPRKSSDYVCNYMEQRYVDTYGSFAEKIEYKKNSRKPPFAMERYQRNSFIPNCGQDPVYRAYHCEIISESESFISIKYKVHRGCVEDNNSEYRTERVAIA